MADKSQQTDMGATFDYGGRSLRRILIIAAIAIIVLFFMVVAIPLTSNQAVCGSCHSMQEAHDSWRKSSHAAVTCYACHTNPSVSSFLSQHTVGYSRRIYRQFTGEISLPINKIGAVGRTISNDACLRCHSPETRRVTPSAGLTMSTGAHIKHLKAGLACTICHNRVAHKKTSTKYREGLSMFGGCLRCHLNSRPYTAPNGQKAPTQCTVCHREIKKPASHVRADLEGTTWVKAHGAVARPDMKYCQQCHHPKSKQATGIVACYSCHQVKVPHDPSWKRVHPVNARRFGPERCAKCHKGRDQRDLCQQCHHKGFRPAGVWVSSQPGVSIHPQAVKENGVTPCLQHHAPVFCPRCHIRGPLGYRETYMRSEQ